MPDNIEGSSTGSGVLLGITNFLSDISKNRQQDQADRQKIAYYNQQQNAQFEREQKLQEMRIQAEKELTFNKMVMDAKMKDEEAEANKPGVAVLDADSKKLQVLIPAGSRGQYKILEPDKGANSTEVSDTKELTGNNRMVYSDLQSGEIPSFDAKGKPGKPTAITSYDQALSHVITSGGDPTNPIIKKILSSYIPGNMGKDVNFLGFEHGDLKRKTQPAFTAEELSSLTQPATKTTKKTKTMLGSSEEPSGYKVIMPGTIRSVPAPQSTGSQAFENSQSNTTAQLQAPKAKTLDEIFQ